MKSFITVHKNNRSRVGVFLIEMLVVITISSVILVLCIGLIRLSFSLERKINFSTHYMHTISNVSDVFREDVHAAQSGIIQEEKRNDKLVSVLVITKSSAEKIHYFPHEHFLERVVVRGDKTVHHEKYPFPERSQFEFTIDMQASRIALLVKRPTASAGGGNSTPVVPGELFQETRFEAVLNQFQSVDTDVTPVVLLKK